LCIMARAASTIPDPVCRYAQFPGNGQTRFIRSTEYPTIQKITASKGQLFGEIITTLLSFWCIYRI
ncbi:hypothetical protein, partial [Bifidobacterium crudilactis]|uniref:hypothetical protein n=1 Tax=Bifidobacterium crudilactis TaxID=327277 RepID=UPI0023555456